MKKIIMLLMLCCSFAFNASAQATVDDLMAEIDNIKQGYEKVKYDTLQNLETRKIATFKLDAIEYLQYENSDKGTLQWNEVALQVNYMIEFVNAFLSDFKDSKSTKAREEVSIRYKTASLQHPLFGNSDADVAYAYVDNNSFITQFSLDTDWVKAYDVVKK